MTSMAKSPHSIILLVFIERLLHKIVRCTMFLPGSFEKLVVSRIVFCSIVALSPAVLTEAKRASLRFIAAVFIVHFFS